MKVKLFLGEIKKVGQEFFFENNQGGKDFLKKKRGAKTSFQKKIRGRRLFFQIKKGGVKTFFQTNFSQNPATCPANFDRFLRDGSTFIDHRQGAHTFFERNQGVGDFFRKKIRWAKSKSLFLLFFRVKSQGDDFFFTK